MKTMLALSFAVLLAAAGCSHSDKDSDRRDSNRAYSSTEARVKDPVCGMMCEKSTAKKVDHDGKSYYFCSDECASKFRSNPGSFVSR